MAEDDNRQNLIFLYGLAFIFIPWIILQSFIRIPADAAWLMSAAEHILNGQALTQYYFDTNPPLCFIIFIPAVLLDKLGFTTWQALQIYTGLLSIFSLGLSAYSLKQWPVSNTFRLTILVFYAAGLFCIPFLEYGQKDHLIAIILMPFLLAQLSITYKHTGSKTTTILTLLFFAPFILTKPHYGLLPAAVILHRLFERKSLRVIFDADFIILAIGTIIYVAATVMFFPDFIKEVLPLSLSLYVNQLGNPDIHKYAVSMMFLALCFTGVSALSEKQNGERTLSVFLGVFAILAVIPYWVQWKGFSLHLIPFNIMAVSALGASIALYNAAAIQKYFKILLGVIFLASLGCAYVIWENKDGLTHDYYRNHLYVELIKPTGNEKSFYIESNSTNTVLQLGVYHDMEFASRFVANWFTYNLMELPEEQRIHYWQLLGDYYAQDLERYKPEYIVLLRQENLASVLEVFKVHENFQAAFAKYESLGIRFTDEIFMNSEKVLGSDEAAYGLYKRKID